MGRKRLTNRKRQAVEEYPGTMNQPDRQFKSPEQYDTDTWESYEQQDLRHDWQSDKRDEMGFGIPEQASWKDQPTAKVKQAAAKAIKLAVCLLGDKVDDDVIEDQASDFMALGLDGIDAGLNRLAETNHLFVKADDDDDDDDEDSDSDKEASIEAADDDEDDDDSNNEDSDSDKEASEIEFDVSAGSSDIDNDGEETIAGMWVGAGDIDDEPESSDQDDGRVAKTKKKGGIKKLGGQTKVASDPSDNEVNPWAGSLLDSPDVSDIFN